MGNIIDAELRFLRLRMRAFVSFDPKDMVPVDRHGPVDQDFPDALYFPDECPERAERARRKKPKAKPEPDMTMPAPPVDVQRAMYRMPRTALDVPSDFVTQAEREADIEFLRRYTCVA